LTDAARASRLCWIAGVPAAGLVTVSVLLAESARSAGHHGLGDALSVVQFLVYFAWFRLAWRASRNIPDGTWKPVARGALAAGLVLSAML
jgi:hypothetical protein